MRKVHLAVSVGAVISLSACGGGSSSALVSDPLAFGATDNAASGNGLPFASDMTMDTDAVGIEIPVTVATVAIAPSPENTTLAIAREAVVLTDDFVRDDIRSLDLTLAEDTITFVDGRGETGTGNLANIFFGLGGEDSIVMLGNILTAGPLFDPSAMYVFPVGFETAPDVVASQTGLATLRGEFQMYGPLFTNGEIDFFDSGFLGDINVRIDFDGQTMEGDFTAQNLDIPERFLLEGGFRDVSIVGNGAVGEMEWACDAGATCSATSDFGAVFFGETGSEVTGITTVDLPITVEGDPIDYVFKGVGGFIANSGS